MLCSRSGVYDHRVWSIGFKLRFGQALLARHFLASALPSQEREKTLNKEDCQCDYFFVAEISCEDKRVRLRPQSLEGLREHVGHDRAMAMGLLLEVARTLGQLGFVASREGVAQEELKVDDPMMILSGERTIPWRLEIEGQDYRGVLRTMYCCEGHGNPYYCTSPR